MIRALAVVLFAAVALARPDGGYRAPRPTYGAPCGDGLVRKADGNCVQPVVTRNLFLYNAPAQKITYGPAPYIPDPQVHYNYVFVRTPGALVAPEPIVVGPPQQKTLVYLLSKRQQQQQQRLIQVEGNPTNPEVYFVSYKDGENPDLPGGIDLQTALSQSAAQGQVISGSGFGGSSGSGEGHGSGGSSGSGEGHGSSGGYA